MTRFVAYIASGRLLAQFPEARYDGVNTVRPPRVIDITATLKAFPQPSR
jgi:hypothetical protein